MKEFYQILFNNRQLLFLLVELMIAVKHSSGCWSQYPCNDNAPVPLSDYQKAKLELEKLSISLKGELIHPQSGKLAKILGLTIKENYAYLIK
jgi:hypothetical protein